MTTIDGYYFHDDKFSLQEVNDIVNKKNDKRKSVFKS